MASGNVDDDEQSGFPSEAVIELAGRCIAIRHIRYKDRKLTKDRRAFWDRDRPDIYVFGHMHQQKTEWFGKTLLFNPGSAGPSGSSCHGAWIASRSTKELFQRTILS